MNDAVFFVLALGAGIMLGLFFFGGLWWTVRKGVSSRQPALWFFGSLLLRTSITLAGFYLVGRDHWQRLLSCLCGFVIARLAVMWMTRPWRIAQRFPVEEASHASDA